MNHVWVSVSHRGYLSRFSPTFVSANPSSSVPYPGGERRAVADILDPAKRGKSGNHRGGEEQRALRTRLRGAEDHGNEHERRKRRKVRPDRDRHRRERARPGGAAARPVGGRQQRPQPAGRGRHVAHRLDHLIEERWAEREHDGGKGAGQRVPKPETEAVGPPDHEDPKNRHEQVNGGFRNEGEGGEQQGKSRRIPGRDDTGRLPAGEAERGQRHLDVGPGERRADGNRVGQPALHQQPRLADVTVRIGAAAGVRAEDDAGGQRPRHR